MADIIAPELAGLDDDAQEALDLAERLTRLLERREAASEPTPAPAPGLSAAR